MWSLGCVHLEELNNTHDTLFLQKLTTKILKPRHHSNKLGTTASTDSRWTVTDKVHSCAEAKACIDWIQWVSLEDNTSKKQSTKGIVNSNAFPNTSRRFNDTEVDLKLTEQHDGRVSWLSLRMLSKLEIGTKNIGLTYSVVPPTNPERSVVRTSTERSSTFVHCKATVVGSQSIQTCSLWHPNTEPSSRQRTIDWKGPDDEPRVVLYKHSNRPDHDCHDCINLRLAQNAIWCFIKVAVTRFFDNMPASTLDKVVTLVASEVLFERNLPDFDQVGGESWRTKRLAHIRSTRSTSYRSRESGKHFLCPDWQQVLNSPNKSMLIADLIKNCAQKKDRARRMLSCVTEWFRDSCWTKRPPGTTWSFKDRGSCAMPKTLKKQETRRNMLRLWSYATGHCWGGHEAGRGTNQQTIHPVCAWHSWFWHWKIPKEFHAVENRKNR